MMLEMVSFLELHYKLLLGGGLYFIQLFLPIAYHDA